MNFYGFSPESIQGNGAIIITTPDTPTSLVEVYAQRTKSTLGLSWTAPVFAGGTTILYYRVSYAQQGQAFDVYNAAVTTTSVLVSGLTAGTTYEFKVEARNSYSHSPYSQTITLLCAFVPEPPISVSTTNSNNKVAVSWSEPVSNGSPITAYKVLVKEKSSGLFT
jgi:hypothetical protein